MHGEAQSPAMPPLIQSQARSFRATGTKQPCTAQPRVTRGDSRTPAALHCAGYGAVGSFPQPLPVASTLRGGYPSPSANLGINGSFSSDRAEISAAIRVLGALCWQPAADGGMEQGDPQGIQRAAHTTTSTGMVPGDRRQLRCLQRACIPSWDPSSSSPSASCTIL